MSNSSVTEGTTTAPARTDYFSPAEAAASVGMNLRSFYSYVEQGIIPGRRVGRKILIPVDFMDHLPAATAPQAASQVQQ